VDLALGVIVLSEAPNMPFYPTQLSSIDDIALLPDFLKIWNLKSLNLIMFF
jgi:hypothetical protein